MESEQVHVRFFSIRAGARTIEIIDLIPDSRWEVFARDPGTWRAGLYRPDCRHQDEITILEKHTCPELFVCLGGRAGLLLKRGDEERLVEMKPNQAMVVTDYHNGFAIDPEGHFLVVEGERFSTDYVDRANGAFIRRVEVTPGNGIV